MNGAESLVETLVATGIEVCFTNPGTSEMHFIAALDKLPGVRCVLCLFEGVATGAADGYARMAGKPAATLLHLGSGLGNGMANLHNAGRAYSPIVNIVGDHATYHRKYDAPLTSDIEGAARTVSRWVRTASNSAEVGALAALAVMEAASPPGGPATLILPANGAWDEGGRPGVPAKSVPPRETIDDSAISQAVEVLGKGGEAMLLIGCHALLEEGLELAGAIADKTGCKLRAPWSNARIARGAGRVPIERIPYPIVQAIQAFDGIRDLVLVGAKSPVAFFAYPDKPSDFVPEGCRVHNLGGPEGDQLAVLRRLYEMLECSEENVRRQPRHRPDIPTGEITKEKIAALLGALMPEDAIVCDESLTTGRAFFPQTAGAPKHDWLQLTGGAIGMAMSLSVGAAIACPGRQVLCLQSDGGGLYTNQALWTQAREKLDVVTLIWANRSYETLRAELSNVGVQNVGRKALDMLSLTDPMIDWVSLAGGLGVSAAKVNTMEEFHVELAGFLEKKGPGLIEVVL